MSERHSAENGPRCPVTTESGTPCQKARKRMRDGEWLHAGGHWFASDDLHACMTAGHFDPSNVLSMTPLVHLDVPCPRRVIPPEASER